jgi:chromate transporter
VGAGLLHGLKLVAVAIVAQAVMGMARGLCPDRVRASIATVALVVMLVAPWSIFQIGTIVVGGLAGWILCPGEPDPALDSVTMPVSRKLGIACLTAFFVLLAFAFLPARAGALALLDAFYRSGALVFGGGHVVLPLLRNAVVVPGWVSDNTFLAGYGAAQAVPGPLFTFSAYLGAVAGIPPGGVIGAAVALVAIFVPGILCRHSALLARVARQTGRASCDARHQCRRCRVVGSSALQPSLDQCGAESGGFRDRGNRLRPARRLECTAAHSRGAFRAGRGWIEPDGLSHCGS